MENYVIAELEIVALAAAETVSASTTVVPGDNELPIDPANKNGTTYSLA